MFPEDFNGIVVGSPAVNFNNMSSWRASFFGKTGAPSSPNFIPASTWQSIIHDEVLNQCDAIDGVIEDPTLCDFRPEVLICRADQNSINCLKEAQIEIVRSILLPLYGSSGELVYLAMQPGSEAQAIQRLYFGTPFPYSLVCTPFGLSMQANRGRTGSDTLSMATPASMMPFSAS